MLDGGFTGHVGLQRKYDPKPTRLNDSTIRTLFESYDSWRLLISRV